MGGEAAGRPAGDAGELGLEQLKAQLRQGVREPLELVLGQRQRRAATFNTSRKWSDGASTRSSPASKRLRSRRAASTFSSPSG
jgi:hypothetical protein